MSDIKLDDIQSHDRHDFLTETVLPALAHVGSSSSTKKLADTTINRVNAERRLIRLERARDLLETWKLVPGRDYTVWATRPDDDHWCVNIRLEVAGLWNTFAGFGNTEITALETALTRAGEQANEWAEHVEDPSCITSSASSATVPRVRRPKLKKTCTPSSTTQVANDTTPTEPKTPSSTTQVANDTTPTEPELAAPTPTKSPISPLIEIPPSIPVSTSRKKAAVAKQTSKPTMPPKPTMTLKPTSKSPFGNNPYDPLFTNG